jgi:phospholipase C
MYQTNQGPSFPAHQYIFGGTSAPNAAADAQGTFASENMSNSGISGTSAIAGCIADPNTRVQLIDAYGVENPANKTWPCFEHRTIPDLLPSTISWRYYTPGAGSIWTAPNAIRHICESTGPGGKCQGSAWSNNVDLRPVDVLTDIASCKLRSLSWVIPSGQNSDHARGNDGGGPSWVASIVNAIGNSNACDGGAGYWNNTAIIITWDDWGGWYDHVAPRILPFPQGGYQMGFRVPMIFVSAYTPAHYINNTPHDFGSILRFVEHNFGLVPGELHFADERATNRLDAFYDLTKPPRPFKTIAAAKTASFFVHDKRALTDPDDQ